MNSAPRLRLTPRLVFGTAVLALGVLLTLDNLDIIRIGRIWDYWPVVLIAIGLAKATDSRGAGRGFGLAFAFVGLLLLLDNLRYIRFEIWDLWPLTLVLIGIGLLWGTVSRTRFRGTPPLFGTGQPAPGTGAGAPPPDPASPDATIRAFALLSSTRRTVTAQDFRGGEITAFLGSCEIDLRGAAMKQQAVLEVTTVFGGIEIRIPSDWNVFIDGTFMGGVEDRTVHPANPVNTLVVRGFAVLGGVELAN